MFDLDNLISNRNTKIQMVETFENHLQVIYPNGVSCYVNGRCTGCRFLGCNGNNKHTCKRFDEPLHYTDTGPVGDCNESNSAFFYFGSRGF